MDPITSAFLNEFIKNFEVQEKKVETQFEMFVNYCVIAKEYNSTGFEYENIMTGEATQGIDGIGIIVNNKLVNTIEEVENLIQTNRYLDVDFIMIQSKTSNNFDNKEILNFFAWVKSYYNNSSLFSTEEMNKFIEIKDYIFSMSQFMENRSPKCKLYYVTTGTWTDDKNLLEIVNANKKELENTNLFSEVEFIPCDGKYVQKLYRKTKEKLSATFILEKKITLPKIEGVEVAYYGIIPFDEYKKIINDEDNGRIRPVFDDNIRDYLGENNDVNTEIQKTINNNKFDFFSILNNGVTVVADKISGTGDTITITDYQVVNGCQTSHVLFNNINKDGIENVFIPLRIVITQRDDIKNDITKATNSQSEVKKEQLESLSEFQRDLEVFYKTIDDDDINKLYYERRTNQYNTFNIQKTRIIDIPTQIKVFTSMFLNNPHGVSGYYGTIAKKMGNKIFKQGHKHLPYYTSSLAYYKLESLFRTNKIDKSNKRMRYHILMAIRIISTKNMKMPEFNSNKIEGYCKPILEVICDNDKLILLVEDIMEVIKNALGDNLGERKVFEKKETTDLILNEIKKLI
ncbi:MAG: AIPR family protein [Clostridium paraputrificum]|uniref:AIPR family protein n=1 Tax=Clostridium paraputrificum TaxID=29363 RepID=UPI00374E4BB7